MRKETEMIMEFYHRGQTEAWEAAKKIALNPTLGGFTPEELMDVLGTKNSCQIFLSVSPVDAIQKILDYEFETALRERRAKDGRE